MPPAPARIARTPRQNSRTSRNPAVPPPPVPGAAVGNGLGDGDGDGLGLGVVALGTTAPGVLAVAVGVVLAVAVGVMLAEIDGVAVAVPPGAKEVGVVDGEPPPKQADTDTEVRMAKAAQPRALLRKRRRP